MLKWISKHLRASLRSTPNQSR